MAEPTPVQDQLAIMADTPDKKYTLYSTTGQRYPAWAFDEAMRRYTAEGKVPEGFTILPQDALTNKIRYAYEYANQPVQDLLRKAGRFAGEAVAPTSIVSAAEKLGLAQPGTAQAMTQASGSAGEGVGSFVGAPFRTPKAALTTAGSTAAAWATGGASLVPQIGGQLVGPFLGHSIGSAMTGEGFDFGGAAIQAGLMALAKGGVGAFQHIMGVSTSQQAQSGVKGAMTQLVKDKLGPVADDPGALNAMLNTAEGLKQFTQMGAKALRSDLQSITDSFIQTASKAAPHGLTGETKRELTYLAKQFFEAGNSYLDDIGNANAKAGTQATFEALKDRFGALLATEYKNASPAIQRAVAASFMKQFDQQTVNLNRFVGGAELLDVFKRSNVGGGGFNVEALQRAVEDRFLKNPGSLVETAGNIVRRGAPTAEGFDRTFNPRIPLPRWVGGGKIPLGHPQVYVGSVPGTGVSVGTGLAGRAAIQSYFEKARE